MYAIAEGTFAIWGYGPKSGITDGGEASIGDSGSLADASDRRSK